MSKLLSFLEEYRSQKDETSKAIYTHTSLGTPKGSFNIPPDRRTKLHELVIQTVFEKNTPVHLTESPLKCKIITIDIDLRYPQEFPTRQHTEKHIRALVNLYNEAIIHYIDVPPNQYLKAYVFERDAPYPYRGDFKDGIHIIYPEICTDVSVQHLIRNYVMKHAARVFDNKEIGALPYKNPKGITDVIDISVIDRNNWMLFGCTKPGYTRYDLTYVLENQSNGLVELEHLRKNYRPIELINLLSIHESAQKLTPCPIKDEFSNEFQELIEKNSTKKVRRIADPTKQITKRQTSTDVFMDESYRSIEESKTLVNLLAQWRSDDYNAWMEVGMCLYNINDSLLSTWIEFSKRSVKFGSGECEQSWSAFNLRIMGIGSLHRWAKLDNPTGYTLARREFISAHIHRSVSGTTQDVATVVYTLYKHQYICLDPKGTNWMEYRGHRWYRCNGGISLKSKIGNEVLNEYLYLVTHYNVTAMNEDNDHKEQYLQRSKALTEITYRLRDMTFKDKIMKECIVMFYDPNFEQELDVNPDLIGFENGVYDLKEGQFRNGRPEDRISMSTGHDFIEYSDIDVENEYSDEPLVAEINDFMAQVFPTPSTRRYVWKMLASFIQGHNPEELFHIWNGIGGNGKSKLLELFENAFGEYCFKIPVSFVTQKRGASNAATPEISRGKGRRLGSFQEPDEGVRMNMGIVKEISGGDKLYRRGLYKEGDEYKPQFKLVFLTNYLPKVPSNDEGTWRRLVVIMFNTKFVNDPTKPNERKKDPYISQKIVRWASTFMFMLTEWFKIYKREGLKIQPEEISKATSEYRKESDAYEQFKDEFLLADPDGVVKLDESYTLFQDWYTKEYNDKAPIRREYKSNMERKLGQRYEKSGKTGWTGWVIKYDESDIAEKITTALADTTDEKPKIKITVKKS